jgi:hypothetical protein
MMTVLRQSKRYALSNCVSNLAFTWRRGIATFQLETVRYPSTEVAENISLIGDPAKTSKKPLLVEFNL